MQQPQGMSRFMDVGKIRKILELGGLHDVDARFDIAGHDPILPTRFHASEVLAGAMGLVGRSAANLWVERGGEDQAVTLDVRGAASVLVGPWIQTIEGADDPYRFQTAVTGIYGTADDRWIQLHGGYPHLLAGTCRLLGVSNDAGELESATRRWQSHDLEDALADAGMCAVVVRSAEEWAAHPQGIAARELPVVSITRIGEGQPCPLAMDARPLGGVRVLDTSRIIAGPCAARTLAAFGADVLNVRAEHLPFIESFIIHTGSGKRNAFLDLRDDADFERMLRLVDGADVFIQSYRPGSFARRGLGPEHLAERRPGIVYVSVSCYGGHGPWAHRGGWEQHGQAATGISSDQSGLVLNSQVMLLGSPRGDRPEPIPGVFTDFATGYLAAYGAIEALRRRALEGGSWHVEVSLVRSGMWLHDIGADLNHTAAPGTGDVSKYMEYALSDWGRLHQLGPVIELEITPPHWSLGPTRLGTSTPAWIEVRK